MTGTDWMPDDPVPMTATRLPVKSTGSCGQCSVWYTSPANVLNPGKSGVNAADSGPVAMMQNRAEMTSPPSVVTVQRSVSSSSTAEATLVLNVIPERRSSLSATHFMYRRISPWVAYFSVHVHSSCSSSENE